MSGESGRFQRSTNPYVVGLPELKYGEAGYFENVVKSLFERTEHIVVPWRMLAIMAVWSSAVALRMNYARDQYAILDDLSAIEGYLAGAAGFFLGFRMNAASARWLSSRNTVGKLLSSVVDLGKLSSRHMGEKEQEYTVGLLNALTVAFCGVFAEDGPDQAAVAEFLGDSSLSTLIQQEAAEEPRETFDALLLLTKVAFQEHAPEAPETVDLFINIESCLEDCLMVFNTPPPLGYTAHLRVMLFLNMGAVPLTLASKVTGPGLVAVSLVVAYAFLSVDALASMVGHPFGDDADDLPLGDYAAEARHRLQRNHTITQRLLRSPSDVAEVESAMATATRA